MFVLQRSTGKLDKPQRRTSIAMSASRKIRPVNSLIFVSDPAGGDVPEWIRDASILSTSSCVSVGCYPEQDGPTEVILGKAEEIDPGFQPAFDGDLATPNRAVVVSTVERKIVLESKVPEMRTHVRIWINHPRWPDKIIVGFG
jgi:hypothetical protein